MAHYKISPAQLRCICALGRKAGMDADDLRGNAHRIGGVDSLKELSSYEASRLIDELRTRLGEMPGIPAQSAAGMATPAQERMIYRLEREMGWFDNPARLRGWLKRRFGREEARWLTTSQASQAIEGLKAMRDGQRAERPYDVDPETGEILPRRQTAE